MERPGSIGGKEDNKTKVQRPNIGMRSFPRTPAVGKMMPERVREKKPGMLDAQKKAIMDRRSVDVYPTELGIAFFLRGLLGRTSK